MVYERSLIQVIALSPVRVCPGLQFTSTTVPTMTGKEVVVVMSDSEPGKSVHVSEGDGGDNVVSNTDLTLTTLDPLSVEVFKTKYLLTHLKCS